MPSLLVHYDNETLQTRNLEGNLRSLAWAVADRYLLVVGNNGRVYRIDGEKSIALNALTQQNLRAVSVNPKDGTALIVGNTGTILLLNEHGEFTKVDVSTTENLRAVAWNKRGTVALVAGNAGTLLKYYDGAIETIDNGRANLRHISWRPVRDEALISSNCFAEEFIPSSNLFCYDAMRSIVTPVNEGRADLIGVDWKPTGESALVVGYDVVWHNGFIGNFSGTSLSPVSFENRRVYPVAVAWNPSGDIAAIVTATTQRGMGRGIVYLWDGKSLKPIYNNDGFFFSAVAWNGKGKRLAALASPLIRTFNC